MGNDLAPTRSSPPPWTPDSEPAGPFPASGRGPPTAAVPALLWTTDEALRVTWIGGGAGQDPAAWIGRPASDLFDGGAADGSPVLEGHRAALSGETRHFLAPRRGTDHHVCVAPMRDARGKVVGVAGVGIASLAERQGVEEELRASGEQLRRLTRRVQEVREAEQERIGREVHDEIGQRLAALRMDLAWLLGKTSRSTKDRVVEMIGNVDETIAAVRRVARELRPPILERLGLHAAIGDLVDRVMGAAQVPCDVNLDFDETAVDRERGITVYRVVQEALTNVLAHAQATRAAVNLFRERGTLVVQVLDDGRGIPEAEVRDPRAMGLAGMRERVAVWGGEIEIRGDVAGTTVTARIPLETPPEEEPR